MIVAGRIEKLARMLAVITVALVLSACGEDRTGTIPNATDPTSGSGGFIPTSPVTQYNFPDFTSGAPINLYDVTNYTGTEEFMKPDYFYAPVIGNPLIMMQIKSTLSSTITEKIYVQVEDQRQAWAAGIPTVKDATIRSSTALDMTFSDNYITVRVKGTISGSLLGTATNPAIIYYRNRLAGETQCFTRGTLDVATPCRDVYMDPSNSRVKKLGSFSATYTNWLK